MPSSPSASASASADHIFIGRQPIMGRDREVVAYELLHRDGILDRGASGSAATSRVLIHSLVNIGLDSVVGRYPAFINATEQLLLGQEIELFPPERVVFEILEDIQPGPELVARIEHLRQQGFRFALDDFIYHSGWDPILEQVQYVKLDVLAHPIKSAAELAPLRRPGVQLLAEKLETYEEFQHYHALGFELFQGYFLCRPETLRGRAPAASQLTIIRVLGMLSEPTFDTTALAGLIGEDASLCYQLLRLSNSAAYARARAVATIEDAVIRVGRDNIRHWVSLLLLTQDARKPHELLLTAMVRARMCEQLAVRKGSSGAGAYFIAGLLSAADALFDRPFSELISSLPLSEALREGLLEQRNPIGECLSKVLGYERMLADGGRTFSTDDTELDHLRALYFEALRWAQQLESQIAAE